MGVGFILGARYQKKIDVKSVQRHLKEVMVFTKAAAPMFPNTMPISEIKELLSKLPDAQFVDALVTQVNGVQELIIRV